MKGPDVVMDADDLAGVEFTPIASSTNIRRVGLDGDGRLLIAYGQPVEGAPVTLYRYATTPQMGAHRLKRLLEADADPERSVGREARDAIAHLDYAAVTVRPVLDDIRLPRVLWIRLRHDVNRLLDIVAQPEVLDDEDRAAIERVKHALRELEREA